jgi:hypothetical protein
MLCYVMLCLLCYVMLWYLICTFFYRSRPHLQRAHREQPKHLRSREEDLVDPLYRDIRPVRGRRAHRHLPRPDHPENPRSHADRRGDQDHRDGDHRRR